MVWRLEKDRLTHHSRLLPLVRILEKHRARKRNKMRENGKSSRKVLTFLFGLKERTGKETRDFVDPVRNFACPRGL